MSSLFLTNTVVTDATSAAETTRHRAAPSAGGAATIRNKNTVAGPTAALKVTDSAVEGTDGASIAWYSDPLQAVTIAGQIVCNLWDRENANANNVAPAVGIYRASAVGAELATIVNPATNNAAGEMAPTAGGVSDVVTITAANVADTAISAGERIKIALFIDDAADHGGTLSMATGGRGVFWVNGTTGSQGQSEIVFTETLITQNPTIWAGQRIVRQGVKRSYNW